MRVALELDLDTAADVLRQMHEGLGDFDPETRALVALRPADDGSVDLVDVDLADNGILEVEDDVPAIVLVTGDRIAIDESGEIVDLRQLLCVLRDGDEVGVFRLGDDPELYVWNTVGVDTQAEELRPRDVAANAARRALGQPSFIDDVPITELLARLYLMHLAQETLIRFDDPDEGGPVSPDDLAGETGSGPFEILLSDDAYPDDEVEAARQLATEITWEDVRRIAARGEFDIGPYEFDPDHAAWLDARGFAQHFDETVMPTEELLGAIQTMGDDALVGWVLERLLERDWYSPTVGLVTGDLAAAQQAASNDPQYGDA